MSDKQGPTGGFPDGKMGDSDRGELAMRIYVAERPNGEHGVVVDFDCDLSWIGLSIRDARELARLLMTTADGAEAVLNGDVEQWISFRFG